MSNYSPSWHFSTLRQKFCDVALTAVRDDRSASQTTIRSSSTGSDSTAPKERTTRVVIVAPVLPYDGIPHAGGVYLQQLHRALVASGTTVTFLVQDKQTNRDALDRPGSPAWSILLSGRRSILEKAFMRLAWSLARRDPTWPPLPVIGQLVMDPRARKALREADIVDLHWPEYAHLLPLIGVLNHRARRIATLYDVLSQRWERRQKAARPNERAYVARATRSAKRLEISLVRRADQVIVFSAKDRCLLPQFNRESIEIVNPPLAPIVALPRVVNRARPTVVFVSALNRPENDDAARWLVQEIWPLVVEQMPSARLRLVGEGASRELGATISVAVGVELAGFVPELAFEYAAAAACVVPLRMGAGVKFKTIEALVAGVPLVTTTVGAEGIAGADRFATLSEDANEIAGGLVGVLQNPDESERLAQSSQTWALRWYGVAAFEKQVTKIYCSSSPMRVG